MSLTALPGDAAETIESLELDDEQLAFAVLVDAGGADLLGTRGLPHLDLERGQPGRSQVARDYLAWRPRPRVSVT